MTSSNFNKRQKTNSIKCEYSDIIDIANCFDLLQVRPVKIRIYIRDNNVSQSKDNLQDSFDNSLIEILDYEKNNYQLPEFLQYDYLINFRWFKINYNTIDFIFLTARFKY